jgi:hypothetical protein
MGKKTYLLISKFMLIGFALLRCEKPGTAATPSLKQLPIPSVGTIKRRIDLNFDCMAKYDISPIPVVDAPYQVVPTFSDGNRIKSTAKGTVQITATYQVTKIRDPRHNDQIVSETETLLSADVTAFSYEVELDSKAPSVQSRKFSSDEFTSGSVDLDPMTSTVRNVFGHTKAGGRFKLAPSAASNVSFFDPPGSATVDIPGPGPDTVPTRCYIGQTIQK